MDRASRENSKINLQHINLKKAHLDGDSKNKTHFKAAANYLVSPEGKMLSDQILTFGDVSIYEKHSIAQTIDDEKVAVAHVKS